MDGKDYSLDGNDREEWDRLWSGRTQRLLPGACKLNLGHHFAALQLARATITDDPPEVAGLVSRGSEVCPICGESTAGDARVAALLDVTFANGLGFGMGVWAHHACFEACSDTGLPARIPW